MCTKRRMIHELVIIQKVTITLGNENSQTYKSVVHYF